MKLNAADARTEAAARFEKCNLSMPTNRPAPPSAE